MSITEASAFGRIDLVREYLRIDPGAVNTNERRTPLHEAAGRGNRELVELLLANGADPASEDENGLRPIDWARHGKHGLVISLLERGQSKTP